MENTLGKTYILGVGITTAKESTILEFIKSELKKPRNSREKIVVFTPNPEQIAQAQSDSSLRDLLNSASVAIPDGAGVVRAARALGKPIHARIAGIDFMKNMLDEVANWPIKTGYLGGQLGVAEEASERLQKSYPSLQVSYASHAYERQKLIQSDIDILFVAMGFPKQEKWIIEHKDEIGASVIMAVGGSFDFISGRVVRAPKFIRDFGLEWLFRLIIQPWRFKRQLRIWHFGALILKEWLSDRLKPSKK